VVHIGESTLQQRLDEFENTQSGTLTIEEFDEKAAEFEEQQHNLTKEIEFGVGEDLSGMLTCEHRGMESVQHFAHGMCRWLVKATELRHTHTKASAHHTRHHLLNPFFLWVSCLSFTRIP
jgi:hypothetical protein